MTRFSWVAWGLLVVVLDLPLGAWDVISDVVGYAWLLVALAGAERVHRGFLLARAGAVAGLMSSFFTGTPLLGLNDALHIAALVVQAIAFATVIFGLASGVLATAPESYADMRRWAAGLRWAAVGLGALLVIADPAAFLVSTRSSGAMVVAALWLLARLAEAVIGIIAVVLLHRVNRAGWLAPSGTGASTSGPAEPATP